MYLQSGGERVETQDAGKHAAFVQRLSSLGFELLVGFPDQWIGLGVDAGAQSGCGVFAGDGLGLA